MKWTLLLLLGLLGCHGRPQASAAGDQWAASIADQLYERQILSKAGREELQRQVADGRLFENYSLIGSSREGVLNGATPAAVLRFCAQAFEAAQMQRSASLTERQTQQLQAALRKTPVDTASLLRQFASPGAAVEQAIRQEDPPVRAASGWTIYPPLTSGVGNSREDPIAATRSVFGKTRTRTARDLYELGLLTKADYQQVQQELAAQQLATEAGVCQLAAQLALARATYQARRAAFDSLLLRLRQANVLTAKGQQRALADARVTKGLTLDALLPYCQPVRVLKNLPRPPPQLYLRLLAEAAQLLPAFRYTEAQAKLTEKPADNGTTQELLLSFAASGRRYAHHLRLGYQPSQPLPMADKEPYIDSDALAGINQWLRDQAAPERLYLAYLNTNAEEKDADLPSYTLVLLTPAQLAAWGEPGAFSGPEQAAEQITSAHIEQALALYQQLGLLKSLSPAELAEGRRQALSGEASSYLDLLRSFPRLVVSMGGEDAEEPQAYARVLARVAAATRGAFRPTSVRDDFPGQQVRKQKSAFSFTCGTQHYKISLVSDLGWMDLGFVGLVERAVRDNTTGRLYYLGDGDETGLYCFLTPSQAAALRQAQPELFEADDAEEASKKQKDNVGLVP